MQITIKEDKMLDDISIIISCPKINDEVNRLVASLNMHECKFCGSHEGKTYILEIDEVFYIESLEGKTFLYTNESVFESPLRLFEYEEKLSGSEFIQISRQMIVNFNKVSAIEPDIHARMRLILTNGEVVIVSRQYGAAIKKKIELKA